MNLKSLIFIVSLLITGFAHALDLDSAKDKGMVGEQTDGYIGAVTSSSEASALVSEINNKRKQAYADIAKKNNLDVKEVARLAGKKLINKASPSHYVKTPSGTWVLRREVEAQ